MGVSRLEELDEVVAMAENESLDLDNSPRMRGLYDAVRTGSSCSKVSSTLARALIGGLRKALKEFLKDGVTLGELLRNRHSPAALEQLLRQVRGHDYARIFVQAAAVSGPTEKECLAGWVDALLDMVMDQICHRVAGSEHHPTMDGIVSFTEELRDNIAAVVERIATKLAEDNDWLPRLPPTRGQALDSNTSQLMNQSLLRVPSR